MPSVLPSGNLSISLGFTTVGLSALPTISRALARLSTGCSSSLIFTYSALVDRSARITWFPLAPAGRNTDKMNAPANRIAPSISPTLNARPWRRSGSVSMRVSRSATPLLIRRIRKRHPEI